MLMNSTGFTDELWSPENNFIIHVDWVTNNQITVIGRSKAGGSNQYLFNNPIDFEKWINSNFKDPRHKVIRYTDHNNKKVEINNERYEYPL